MKTDGRSVKVRTSDGDFEARVVAAADGANGVVAKGAGLMRGVRLDLALQAEDVESCRRMGDLGAELLPDHACVLTHCNAGALATAGLGTALAPVYRAHAAGKSVSVIADETRQILGFKN